MKSRIYLVKKDTAEFQVIFFGCNYVDIFFNGIEGLKRLVYKKNPNRPEPAIPTCPIVHHNINVTGKNYEVMFTEWMRELLNLTQQNQYMPLVIDHVKVESTSIETQVSFRKAMKRDKLNVPIKAVAYQPAKLEKIKSGYQITVTFDV
jgi:hypothetical protein